MNTPHRPHQHPGDSGNSGDRIAEQLSARLGGRAGHVDLGPPMLDVVVARGRQRQHRRRTAVGVAAVVGIAAGSIAAVNVLSRPAEPDRIAAAPTNDGAAGADPGAEPSTSAPAGAWPTAAQIVPSPFVWNRVDPDSSEAVSFYMGAPDHTMAGSGPFVVWSTAPAVSDNYEGALWRSDDGLAWEQVAAPPSLVGRNIAELNGRFLTYGTAPATSPGRRSDLAVGVSDDDGRTWATASLPLDTSAILAEPGVSSVGVNATSIATTSAGVLVSAQVTAIIDIQSKLPVEARDRSWNYSETGIAVMDDTCIDDTVPMTTISFAAGLAAEAGAATTDTVPASTTPIGGVPTTALDAPSGTVADGAPSSCTYREYTWAELGISARAAAMSIHPEVRMLFSPDGVTFTEFTPTGIDPAATDVRLTAVGDSFAASLTFVDQDGNAATRLLLSADGRTWTDQGAMPISYAEGFGASGDRIVVSGYDVGSSSQVIAVRDPSGTWTTTALQSFVLPSDGVTASMGSGSIAIGPHGISVIGALYVDPVAQVGGVSFSQDGITVEIDDSSYTHRVIDDATGEVLATVTNNVSSNPGLVSAQPNSDGMFEVRREPGGDVVTTYGYDDLNRAVEPTYASQVVFPKLVLLHSTDGVAWSRESLDEIAGAPLTGTGGIRVTDTQVIVAANLAGDRNPNGTAKQTLLVGTFAA
jgi:hypothetical protein